MANSLVSGLSKAEDAALARKSSSLAYTTRNFSMEIRPSYRLRKLFWFLTAIGVMLMVAVSLLSGFLSYLQSEKFVKVVEISLGNLLDSKVKFQELKFKTQGARAQALDVESSQGWTARMDGIAMNYRFFEALQSRELHSPLLTMERAAISYLDPTAPSSQSGKEVTDVQPSSETFEHSLWMLLLPEKLKLETVEVEALRFHYAARGIVMSLEEMPWKFDVSDYPQSLPFSATHPRGARWEGLAFPWSFYLQNLKGRYQGETLHFQNISGRLGEEGHLRFSGTYHPNQPDQWSWAGEATGIHTESLPDHLRNLRENFAGILACDFRADPNLVEGKLTLKDASSPSPLPLRLMGELLRTDRLRRLQWERAEASYQVQHAQRVVLKDLLFESQGLIRIEGDLAIESILETEPSPISGDLWLGVSKAALRWVPAIEKALFTESRAEVSEYVWTKVKVSGTTAQPYEDLSPRLQQVLGQGAVELSTKASGLVNDLLNAVVPAPAKGQNPSESEPAPVDSAKPLPEAMIDQGNRLLESFLPLLPVGP